MKRAILANPVSGSTMREQKRAILEAIVNESAPGCPIFGLETASGEEFRALAGELGRNYEELWVAGGDGTFNDVINMVGSEVVLAYLPMGTGCFLGYTLEYFPQYILNSRVYLHKIAKQIRDGKVHSIDLMLCDETKKGFLASIGFDSEALMEKEAHERQVTMFLESVENKPLRQILERIVKQVDPYTPMAFKAIFGGYKRADVNVSIDGNTVHVPQASSVVVTKVPFFGRGIKPVPQARLDDGNLHVLSVNSPVPWVVIESFGTYFGHQMMGVYGTGKEVVLKTKQVMPLQIDGDIERTGTDFRFEILPDAMRLKY